MLEIILIILLLINITLISGIVVGCYYIYTTHIKPEMKKIKTDFKVPNQWGQ